MAGVLRRLFPQATIAFLGKRYTKAVIESCSFVDVFIDEEEFLNGQPTIKGEKPECIIHVFPTRALALRARELGIRWRIGTTNRWYHWISCNRLVRLSRKNSPLHEAQLNLKLLQPFGFTETVPLEEVPSYYGLTNTEPLNAEWKGLLGSDRYNLILHPKSQGSGREWPLQRYMELVEMLPSDRYRLFVSGTDKERAALTPLLEQYSDKVIDLTGKMPLSQFIAFIKEADGLVASGTGPLHLAAALGRHALGMFPPIRPVHPARWKPLGAKAKVFVLDKACSDCAGRPASCSCIQQLGAAEVKAWLDRISTVSVS